MVRRHMLKEEKRQKTEEEAAAPSGELVAFRDVGELMAAMVNRLAMLYPAARRAIENCGASRCEGAYWQTVTMMAKGELRKPPIAWFRATLKRGMEWTPEEIRLHLNAQHELETREMEQSNDVTMQRLAQERRNADAATDAAAFTGPPAASSTIPSAGLSSRGRDR